MSSYRYWLDIFIILCLLYAPIGVLGPQWLSLDHLPTGGDTASHVFYAYQFCQYFPKQGLTQWLPEVFGGLPFLSYYFPLPFIVIFLLKLWLPFALAFKWGAFLASIVTPACVFGLSVYCFGFSRIAGIFAGVSTLAFLLHEQHAIWGGNLLSVLAGEFGYSYGMLFSLFTLAIWIRALQGRYYWVLGGILEAAAGFSHGYALLITGFSSFFLLFCSDFKTSLRFLVLTHTLAFLLLAGWLWPLLEMHALTIPNDGLYLSNHWQDFLPKTLWPVFLGGLTGGLLYCVPVIHRQWQAPQRQALAFLLAALALSGTFWLGANRIGLADIRFFPFVELFAAIAGGWLLGESLTILLVKLYPHTFLPANGVTLAIIGFMCYWLYHTVGITAQWSAWNHSGYEDKASWKQLSALFPVLAGKPDSSRLLFEHAPVNNDLGSTRLLEALPMFLGGRPVLEGLYMESALLAPAIYYLQSEVSKLPSSPLVRFPSASLDITSAAQHMSLLHSNEVLVRSSESKSAFEKSSLFRKIAESSPFAVYRLAHFDSQFIQLLPLQPRVITDPHWMEHAFNWFKHYPKVDYWPIYTQNEESLNFSFATSPADAAIKLLTFEREKIIFTTNRPGFPHLIKMSFHPRWQLKGKGRIYLAAPGYVVVVPEASRVELVYGTTLIGRWGEIFSSLALLIIIIQLFRKRSELAEENGQTITAGKGLLIWLGLLFIIDIALYQSDPERFYKKAWQELNRRNYAAAAQNLDYIEGRRRSLASQEEALFWAAKAYELAGDRQAAKQHYQKLADQYTGYWVPESLYTLARLQRLDSRPDAALLLEHRLRTDYPEHRLTHALDLQ